MCCLGSLFVGVLVCLRRLGLFGFVGRLLSDWFCWLGVGYDVFVVSVWLFAACLCVYLADYFAFSVAGDFLRV